MKLKKAGVVLKQNAPELIEFFLKLSKILKKLHIKVLLEKNSALTIGINKGKILDFDEMCKESDFIISVGGDGTLLSVARRAFFYDKPVLGINLGTLGFLTDIKPEEVEEFLYNLKDGKYKIDNRMMIEATLNLNKVVALNDIVINRKSISSMVKIDAKVNGKLFNTYYGDGLIISTPTGSSAYNLSCNGPIVYPLTEAFILTPISPHSLTQRPLVLPSNFNLSLSTPDLLGAVIIIDGQEIYTLKQNEELKINISTNKVKLIHSLDRNYFEILNEKLNWGA